MQARMLNVVLTILMGLINVRQTSECGRSLRLTCRFAACLGSCAPQYAQCGGLGYTGSTECCSPAGCQFSNPWYSQCLMGAAQPTDCASVYSQCGGQNWSGSTCCVASQCTLINPYYSQCLPASSSSTSPTSSSSSPSTSVSNRKLIMR